MVFKLHVKLRQCWKLNFDSTRHLDEWPWKSTCLVLFSLAQKYATPPKKISTMIHKPYVFSVPSNHGSPSCHFVLGFLVLVHLRDASLDSQTDFTDISSFLSSTFGTPGRRGGLMVSALVSGSSGPGLSPSRGHCVVFLGKTLYSHSVSLHPGV